MKIIHITASYKPAYIYGGPIMSVAKLCEGLVEQGEKSKEQKIDENNERLAVSSEELEEENEKRKTKNEQETTGHDLLVFTTTANGKSELPVEKVVEQMIDGVRVKFFRRLTKDHSHFSPSLLFSLNLELRHSNIHKIPTVVHIHAWWNLVSVLSCLVAKKKNIPVILSPRGMLTAYSQSNRNGFSKKLIHDLIGKRLLSYCHIHATSELEKIDILKIITPQSITVIPNLVELGEDKRIRNKEQGTKSKDEKQTTKNEKQTTKNEKRTTKNEQQTTNNEQRPFKIIFLSRIEQKKGLELLFEALAQIEFDWYLTIAGSGEESYVESLKLKVESLKLQDKITLVGQVKNEAKFDLLANHDLLTLTSYNENFANVVVESLSVGTPVLLSEQVGLADYVNENKLGWITKLTVPSIADSLKMAYEDFAQREHIRKNAPNQIIKDFNSPELSKRYFKLYEKLIHE